MSHYDKQYFDRMETRRAEQASQRAAARHPDKESSATYHPLVFAVTLIVFLFVLWVIFASIGWIHLV